MLKKKFGKRMLCKTTVSNTLTDHRSNWTTEQVISCRDGLFATNRNTFHMFSVFIVMLWHITHKEAEILSCPGYRSNLRRSNWNDIATYSLALFPHATEFVKKKASYNAKAALKLTTHLVWIAANFNTCLYTYEMRLTYTRDACLVICMILVWTKII